MLGTGKGICLRRGVIMSAISVTPENSSRLISIELLETKTRREDAACIARAIAQLMDHEWREFVDQEQREREQRECEIASLGL